MLSKLFVWAVLGKPPAIYPRHRWLGADNAFDSIGLLQAIGGLYEPTYKLWISQRLASAPTNEEGIGDGMLALEDDIGPADDDAMHNTEAPVEHADPSYDVQNAQNRKQGLEFVVAGGLRMTAPMKILLDPLQRLITEMLELGGEEWEAKQRQREGLAKKGGQWNSKSRTYPLVVFANAELEDRFWKWRATCC